MNVPRRPYRLFPVPLAGGSAGPLQKVLRRRGFEHASLLHYWPEAVGEAYAAYAEPLKLTGKLPKQAGGAVLTVRIHPAYATLFAYESEAVLQRLTRLLGYRPAERIALVH